MKESFYFPHDYNASQDPRILELRAAHGLEAYGLYWCIIESMAQEENGTINRKLMGGLSLGYGVPIDTLRGVMDFCIEIGLFECDGDCVFSPRLLEHKNIRKSFSEAGKKGAEARWGEKKRAKVKKKGFDESAWREMVDFFGTCVKCEGESGLDNVERDHIILTTKGGLNDITNFQPLCASCNASKSLDMTDYRIIFCKKNGLSMPDEWLPHSPPIATPMQRKGKESKVKDKERDKEKKPTPPPPKKIKIVKEKFLEFVELSKAEHEKLITEYGKEVTEKYILRLNGYIGSKGEKYKSHYHTILNWMRKDEEAKKEFNPTMAQVVAMKEIKKEAEERESQRMFNEDN